MGGCILRSKILEVFMDMNQIPLESTEEFEKIFSKNIDALKKLVMKGISNDVYIPVFSSALNFIQGFRRESFNGNFIQAMRDYFGEHGVVIEGKKQNLDWDNLKQDKT